MSDRTYYTERLAAVRAQIARIEDEGVQAYTDDGLQVQRLKLAELRKSEEHYLGRLSALTVSGKRRGNMTQLVPL